MANWLTRRLSRRKLVQTSVGTTGATASLALLGAASSLSTLAQSSDSPARGPVDQNRVKRSGTGLRGYDPDRAWPGYTLFTPTASTNRTVYLIDMEGSVVHTWDMPYSPGFYGYLTDRGTLFYNGKIPDGTWLGRQNFKGGAALEVDWSGRVLWEVQHPHHHHDGIRLRNGNILLLCAEAVPGELAKEVRGGRPGSEAEEGTIYASYLQELTTDGREVWAWRSWEHLDPVADGIPAIQDERSNWALGNGIAELPNGDVLMSFPTASKVIRIDRRTGAITWRLGPPMVAFQHAPTPLANGTVLIFDNGVHRLDNALPFSRVIEVDPATDAIVWRYQDSPPINFYNPRQGNARRLENDNTLICEAQFGRFFEVTREGELVWEYVNPYFGGPPDAPTNNAFRVYRYSPEQIAQARSTA
jgi:Arylsulfotransferase (ASST)